MSDLISRVKAYTITTAWVYLKLLGHMAASTYLVWHAVLHLRSLQTWFASVHSPNRQHLDLVLTVPDPIFTSLDWWKDPQSATAGVAFVIPQPFVSLVSVVSNLGWGVHLSCLRTKGLWSQEEVSLHINIRELKVVHLACQMFLPQIMGKVVKVFTANTAAMIYISKQ